MSKNIEHVQHLKSSVVIDGSPKLPKLPNPSALTEGEIAVNFAEGYETLSIKNNSGNVVTFSSDNYYTEKKLGSGFTDENSGVTVTKAIENSEEVSISSGVTPSGTGIEIWIDESVDPAEADVYTKAQTDSLLNLKLDTSAYTEYWTSGTGENAVVLKNSSGTASGDFSVAEGYQTSATSIASHAEGQGTIANNQSEHASGRYNKSFSASTTFGDTGNTLFSVGNGTGNNARHNAFEIRQNGDIYIVNKNGQDVKLQDEIGNITVDQTIDSGTSASTNAVSTSAVYGFVTSYTPSITVDQVLDDTTSASTNPVSSKAVYDAVTDNELVWTNAFVALSGTVSAHTANTEIHVTAADKNRWDNAGGGFSAITNPSDSNKVGLINKLSQHYDTNIGKGAVIEGDGYVYNGNTFNIVASGDYSHAEGYFTKASGNYSHAEGGYTQASGTFSHAEGYNAVANGEGSHAEGYNAVANGEGSHAEGQNTTANNKVEHASGQYNVSSIASDTFGSSGNTLFSVGNGTALNARHNAFEIRQNGDIYITSGGTDIKLQDNLGVDLSNYYTKSETSGATELTTAFAAKADKTEDLDGVKLKKITQSAYDALVQAGTTDQNTLYVITDNHT